MKPASLTSDYTFKTGEPASTGLIDAFTDLVGQRVLKGTLEVTFPNGQQRTISGQAETHVRGTLVLKNVRAIRRLITHGDIGFAEAYIDGDWETPSLADLLMVGALNNDADSEGYRGHFLLRAIQRIRHLFNANSRRQARKNIAFHYDLGNAFYEQWLDRSMTYSAGIFNHPEESLEVAQSRKYQHLANMLEIKPGSEILEIGCGWGGFMEHVAQQCDARITGVSISEQQVRFACERLKANTGPNKTSVQFKDYRDIEGQYDRIASIEMFEAVGEKYWPVYAEQLKRLLKPNGVAALQIITIDENRFKSYRRSTDFIQQHIFPGGMLPSEQILETVLNDAGLVIKDTYRFGPDYAETLRRWRSSFNDAWDCIERLGFDHRFRRLWDYYLTYCEVGFDTGATDVIQVRLEHG